MVSSSPPVTRGNTAFSNTIAAVIIFSSISCSSASYPAFSHIHVPYFGNNCVRRKILLSSPPFGSSTSINVSREHAQSTSGSIGMDEGEKRSYPVEIHHQGHIATISVGEDEPILQALERQSSFNYQESSEEGQGEETSGLKGAGSSLALSNIPHECRRGNCLTCSSRVLETSDTQNILRNVDNGLSPTVDSELTDSGYILTCCSYVTGPGVVLELDQNDEVWDLVYRRRISDSKQLAMKAQARLLRRVAEENTGKWKRRMEENWESGDNVEHDMQF